MPSVSRAFSIPVANRNTLRITLREPSLTADNLGHKTWAASYLLAKRLPQMQESLPSLALNRTPVPRILELGAGTGLVGIAAAGIFAADVHLTDLPEIVENLASNCAAHSALAGGNGSTLVAFALDWADHPPVHEVLTGTLYDVVLAADPLYSPLHPAMIANTIERYLKRDELARVAVEFPLREAYQPEVDDFHAKMEDKGLSCVEQGEEIGYDDWDGGRGEVRCWWGIWRWKCYR